MTLGRHVSRLALVLACAGCGAGAPERDVPSPSTEVPFEFIRNQILVRAVIQGRGPFSCTVDTGANPSAIDLALARTLGLSMSEEGGPAEGVGKSDVLVYQTEFETTVGSDRPSLIPAVAIDLAPLSAAFGQPIHCVLGQSWLGMRLVQVNYPAKRIGFSTSSDPQCERVPMIFWMPDDLMPLVRVKVNDIEIPVSLDTGSSSTLKLFPEGARAVGIAMPSVDDQRYKVEGARGSAQVTKVTVRSIRFGPLEAANVQVSIGNKNEGEPEGRYGNVGNGLLRLGVVTLDYPGKQITLCPAEHQPK